MQPSDVREAIITELTAVVLSGMAGAGDKLVVLRVALEPESVTERAAMVKLLGCGRDDTSTCARFALYQVVTFHPPSPDIDNRISDDGLIIDDALWTLAEAAADITSVELTDMAVSEDVGRITTRRDVRVIYRHEV